MRSPRGLRITTSYHNHMPKISSGKVIKELLCQSSYDRVTRNVIMCESLRQKLLWPSLAAEILICLENTAAKCVYKRFYYWSVSLIPGEPEFLLCWFATVLIWVKGPVDVRTSKKQYNNTHHK